MNRFVVLTIILVLCGSLRAQYTVFNQEIKLKSLFSSDKVSYPIVDEMNSRFSLLLLDAKTINAYSFDSSYQLIDDKEFLLEGAKNKSLIGHYLEDDKYNLLFAKKNKQHFCLKTFSFALHEGAEIQFSLPSKKEMFVEAVSLKNKLYLLTLVKQSSILKLYKVDEGGLKHLKTFPFKFAFSNTSPFHLHGALSKGGTVLRHHVIDHSIPNPLELTAKKLKLYYYANKIVITLDKYNTWTNVVTINVDQLTATAKFYNTGTFTDNLLLAQSNSYVQNDILYQLKASRRELWFSAIDLESDSVLNEYSVKKDEDIAFINTAITQKGGGNAIASDREKELDETRQLLRKMASSNIGISAYESKHGGIELTIGAYKETNGSNMGMMMPGIPIASVGAMTVSFSPMMSALSAHKASKSVHFKVLIDNQTFRHKKGNVGDNVFEKIASFSDDLLTAPVCETIFRMKGAFYYGYYNPDKHMFTLKKYTD